MANRRLVGLRGRRTTGEIKIFMIKPPADQLIIFSLISEEAVFLLLLFLLLRLFFLLLFRATPAARLECKTPLNCGNFHSPQDLAQMWEKKDANGRAILAKAEELNNKAMASVSGPIALYHARNKESPIYSVLPGPFGEDLTGPHDSFEEGSRIRDAINMDSDGSAHDEDLCQGIHPKNPLSR